MRKSLPLQATTLLTLIAFASTQVLVGCSSGVDSREKVDHTQLRYTGDYTDQELRDTFDSAMTAMPTDDTFALVDVGDKPGVRVEYFDGAEPLTAVALTNDHITVIADDNTTVADWSRQDDGSEVFAFGGQSVTLTRNDPADAIYSTADIGTDTGPNSRTNSQYAWTAISRLVEQQLAAAQPPPSSGDPSMPQNVRVQAWPAVLLVVVIVVGVGMLIAGKAKSSVDAARMRAAQRACSDFAMNGTDPLKSLYKAKFPFLKFAGLAEVARLTTTDQAVHCENRQDMQGNWQANWVQRPDVRWGRTAPPPAPASAYADWYGVPTADRAFAVLDLPVNTAMSPLWWGDNFPIACGVSQFAIEVPKDCLLKLTAQDFQTLQMGGAAAQMIRDNLDAQCSDPDRLLTCTVPWAPPAINAQQWADLMGARWIINGMANDPNAPWLPVPVAAPVAQ